MLKAKCDRCGVERNIKNNKFRSRLVGNNTKDLCHICSLKLNELYNSIEFQKDERLEEFMEGK